MKQFTKEQAIALYESGEWRDWTDEEKVKFQLYQDKLCMPFHEFHQSLGRVLNRPVFLHELGMDRQGLTNEFEGNCNAPTLEEIINLIPEEKRVVLGI